MGRGRIVILTKTLKTISWAIGLYRDTPAAYEPALNLNMITTCFRLNGQGSSIYFRFWEEKNPNWDKHNCTPSAKANVDCYKHIPSQKFFFSYRFLMQILEYQADPKARGIWHLLKQLPATGNKVWFYFYDILQSNFTCHLILSARPLQHSSSTSSLREKIGWKRIYTAPSMTAETSIPK